MSAPAAKRRVLAVVHGEGSVSAMQLAASAAGVCELVWVVDSSQETGPDMGRLLKRLGTTIDVAGLSQDGAAEALAVCRPDGVVAYADKQIPLAAAMAERLGLAYHDRDTARRLVDKLAQRTALRHAGLEVPGCVVLRARPAPDERAQVLRLGFPVVVKPRQGMGSRDTVLVHDAEELDDALARTAARRGPGEQLVAEEYIPGDPAQTGPFADYVSVESVVSQGELSHVAVTGRFPPAEPFRESGFFIPSALSEAQTAAVLEETTAAVEALGVRTGFLHTEVKLTPSGPRLIEVNGRLGGGIPEMLELAAGIDLFGASQRVALGEDIAYDGLVPTDRVAYLLYVQAPVVARRLQDVTGLDVLGDRPEVDAIVLNRRPGEDLDWRDGNHGHVFSVLGTAADHEALVALRRAVDEEVTLSYA